MYSSLYAALRPLRRGGRETHEHLDELRRTEWLSTDALHEIQLRRLKAVIRHAYENVPFYRDRYRSFGIHPDDIRTVSDLSSLPVLTKAEVTEHLDRLVWPERRDQAHMLMTGASTGEPMKFYVEDSFWRWNVAHELRGRGRFGVREGDRIAWVWGALTDTHHTNRRARLKARTKRHRYLNAFGMTDEKMKAFADLLLDWKPAMIRAYASMIDVFARFLQENDITGIRPKLIESGAEKLRPQQRQLVEQVFQAPIADCYVTREFATLAYGCEVGGLHVGETRYLELLDGDRIVGPGEQGKVVITSLHQYLMPFIRYQLDDEAILSPEPCGCGRVTTVLSEILGRSNDYIITANGQAIHDGYFAVYFWSKPEVLRYQVYQRVPERVEVRIATKEPVGAGWLQTVREDLGAQLGPGTEVAVDVVDRIERTKAGKLRFVVSEVSRSLD